MSRTAPPLRAPRAARGARAASDSLAELRGRARAAARGERAAEGGRAPAPGHRRLLGGRARCREELDRDDAPTRRRSCSSRAWSSASRCWRSAARSSGRWSPSRPRWARSAASRRSAARAAARRQPGTGTSPPERARWRPALLAAQPRARRGPVARESCSPPRARTPTSSAASARGATCWSTGSTEFDWQVLPIVAPRTGGRAVRAAAARARGRARSRCGPRRCRAAVAARCRRSAAASCPAALVRDLIGWDGDTDARASTRLVWCRRHPAGRAPRVPLAAAAGSAS